MTAADRRYVSPIGQAVPKSVLDDIEKRLAGSASLCEHTQMGLQCPICGAGVKYVDDRSLGDWDEEKHPRGEHGRFGAGGAKDKQAAIADYKSERPLTGPDSKAIHDVIPGARSVNYFDTPGIGDLHQQMGTPGASGMSKEYEKARNDFFAKQPVETIPFDRLTYTQDRINVPRASALTQAPAQLDKTVFVVRNGDKNYVMNGHHRVVANYMAGNPGIRAHVYTVGERKHSERELADWDEGKHPRDAHGHFTSGGGDSSKSNNTREMTGDPTSWRYAPDKDTQAQFTKDGKWIPERAAMHERLIEENNRGIPVSDNPTVHMMGGGTAAGKSSILSTGAVSVPDKMSAVHVDADEFKGKLPEYQRMVAAGNRDAAAMTHEESSYLAKSALARALGNRNDVVFDGTGDGSADALEKKISQMRANGAKEVVGHYVTVDTETAVSRAIERANQTGRYVSPTVVREIHAAVSRTLPEAINRGLFDRVTLWDTNGSKPRLVVSAVGKNMTVHEPALWNAFLAKGR